MDMAVHGRSLELQLVGSGEDLGAASINWGVLYRDT